MKTNIADCAESLLQSKDRVGTTEMAGGQMSGNATLQRLVDKSAVYFLLFHESMKSLPLISKQPGWKTKQGFIF